MNRQARAEVPMLRQETQFTCCATSIAACLQALGKDQTEQDVNKVLNAGPMRGAAWEAMLATVQYFGLRGSLVVPCTIEMLKSWTDQKIPVVIAWNPRDRPWSHASVVFDVTGEPGARMVHVMDPNLSNPSKSEIVLTEDDFCAKWMEPVGDSLIVRRPAMAVTREVSKEGRQMVASSKEAFLGFHTNPFAKAIRELQHLVKSPGSMRAYDPRHPERPGDARRAGPALAGLVAALMAQNPVEVKQALHQVPPSYLWNVPPEVFKLVKAPVPYTVSEMEDLSRVASDRVTLIRLASSLPVGSMERRAILAGLVKTSGLNWQPLSGPGLEKVLRVFGEQFEGHSPETIYAVKVGRKTVFARDSGVIRLYTAGDDGRIYSMKFNSGLGWVSLQDIQELTSAAAIGMTEEAIEAGVYTNGRLRA